MNNIIIYTDLPLVSYEGTLADIEDVNVRVVKGAELKDYATLNPALIIIDEVNGYRDVLMTNKFPCPILFTGNIFTDVTVRAEGYDFIAKAGTTSCSECPAGSSCAGGDAAAVACAAGTYQPEKKQTTCLTTPVGNYSLAGAENYTACPTTGLKDKDGKTVTATTSGNGATSIMSCYVGPEWYFNDTKGTYHFTSNCNAFDLATATMAQKEERCTSMGGSWDSYGYCEIDFVYPTTESTCNEFDFCSWIQDDPEDAGVCECDCGGYPSVDLENGQIYCHQAP